MPPPGPACLPNPFMLACRPGVSGAGSEHRQDASRRTGTGSSGGSSRRGSHCPAECLTCQDPAGSSGGSGSSGRRLGAQHSISHRQLAPRHPQQQQGFAGHGERGGGGRGGSSSGAAGAAAAAAAVDQYGEYGGQPNGPAALGPGAVIGQHAVAGGLPGLPCRPCLATHLPAVTCMLTCTPCHPLPAANCLLLAVPMRCCRCFTCPPRSAKPTAKWALAPGCSRTGLHPFCACTAAMPAS